MAYNLINLPSQIDSGTIVKANYTYLSDGTKARALDASGVGYDYLGSFTYTHDANNNTTLESVSFGGGRVRKNGSGYDVDYYITDHLGSVRAIVNASGTITEQNDYYPFGTRHPNDLTTLSGNRWRFSGKEEQDASFGVPYSDFGARLYDRTAWTAIDPLAEKYYAVSPYAYCNNNPVVFSDPQGDSIIVNKFGQVVDSKGHDMSVYFKSEDNKYILLGELGGEVNIDYIYSNLLERNERKAGLRSVTMFYFLVKNNGAWDLKQNEKTIWGYPGSNSTRFIFQGNIMEAQDVGNHHFGVVLKGQGVFSEKTGLVGAGIAQRRSGHSLPEWNKKETSSISIPFYTTSFSVPLTRRLPPYGDDPRDQYWIQQGYQYWNNNLKRK